MPLKRFRRSPEARAVTLDRAPDTQGAEFAASRPSILLRSSLLGPGKDRQKFVFSARVVALSMLRVRSTLRGGKHAYWNCQVVQRRQGLRVHYARRRLEGR